MKAIQVEHPEKISLAERSSQAHLSSKEVRVKIKAAGICGSDIHVFLGKNPMAHYPVILGHEAAGIILELGEAVRNLKVGDHVVLEPLVACGNCYACCKGRPNACASMKARGCHIDGFFSEEVVLDAGSVFPISPAISWPDAALVEPYTIGAQVAFRARAEKDDFVLILGAGTMGLTVIDVCKLYGCCCIAVDIDPSRLEAAQQHGADEVLLSDREMKWTQSLKKKFGNHPPNIIVEATGIPAFLSTALELVSSGGRIVNLGFSQDPTAISPLELTRKEVDLLGSRHQTHQFEKVIGWVESAQIQPHSIINHTLPFSDAVSAFTEIKAAHEQHRNFGKVLLVM